MNMSEIDLQFQFKATKSISTKKRNSHIAQSKYKALKMKTVRMVVAIAVKASESIMRVLAVEAGMMGTVEVEGGG